MKKLIYLTFLAIGMTGCSVESMDSEQLLTADAKFKAQEVEKSMHLEETEICFGEAPTFVFNFPQAFNGPNPTDTDIRLQVETSPGSGDWINVTTLEYSGAGPEEYTLGGDFLKIGTYSFRAQIEGGNPHANVATLDVIKCAECVNELTATLTCGEDFKTAYFTFTAEEAGPVVIQGGLTNGTTILNASSDLLERNEGHQSVQNSNSNVTRWEGVVEACEVVTITIEYEDGNGIGNWSAKRGEGDDEEILGTTDALECND